jgi:methionyl-tRNA synthetase
MITSGGKKMSKTLGNIIDPQELIEEYGAEAVRYYLARHVAPFEDGDLTKESFKEAYNANLANGLGNLVARIMKLAETHLDVAPEIPDDTIPQNFKDALDRYAINEAADIVWEHISALDERIQAEQPFKVVKTDPEKGKDMICALAVDLYTTGHMLYPLMPQTSEVIKIAVKENKMPANLFVRKD